MCSNVNCNSKQLCFDEGGGTKNRDGRLLVRRASLGVWAPLNPGRLPSPNIWSNVSDRKLFQQVWRQADGKTRRGHDHRTSRSAAW